MSESPAALPARAELTLQQARDDVLHELLATRARHGWQRLASVLGMSAVSIGVARAGLVPAPWTLVLMYGVPIALVLFMDKVLVALWRRHARRYGLSDEAIDTLRSRLRRLPPRAPPYTTDELLRWVRTLDEEAPPTP